MIATVDSRAAATDPIGLAWLVTVRWMTIAAGIAAVLAGDRALGVSVPTATAAALLVVFAASNVWLMWRVRRGAGSRAVTAAGLLVCADVALLSWLLLKSGGVLNPASAFYLVEIVVAALVLGRTWTTVVTALSVAGYAALFLGPSDELRIAQGMHPEIATHMRGMWFAFALVALCIGVLVTRLALAIERRDRALEAWRDRTARASRFASLATVAAGAAHELSTPLATMAVAAHELERALAARGADTELTADARLIRAEIDRCREVLGNMAGQIAAPRGEAPVARRLGDVVDASLARVPAEDRARVRLDVASETPVVWPVDVVSQAIGNVLHNALQASRAGDAVMLVAREVASGRIDVRVVDRGHGMTAEELARAGEPFYTTKSPGAGTGLGLFVTRLAIEQLDGAVDVASQAGAGTTVTLSLPSNVVATRHE